MNPVVQAQSLAARHKYEQKCEDCGSSDFVDDFQQGDLICRECGLVAEAHAIDVRSEWRTFSDSDKSTVDPNRVGGPVNHLLGETLSTVIGATATGDNAASSNLRRMAARGGGGGGGRNLSDAFRGIGQICEKLSLNRVFKDRACENYKQATEVIGVRGRSKESMWAASVYMACRQELMPRTFKEILAGAPGTTKVDIGRSYTAMKKVIGEVAATHPADCVRRFCSALGLVNQDMKVAVDTAERAVPRAGAQLNGEPHDWDSRSPTTIAAAVIYLVTCLPRASLHPTPSEISRVSGAAEATIRVAYRDLHKFARQLVPAYFADDAAIAGLPDPSGGGS
mmetsp:Transcript_21051/g.63346  ORF Transcript_21051/g.63346 Transcript_21051/m.63346 type:complete len:338 (-) Transcript_21051:1859-2872(-)